jgi:hypothetical protein
MMPVYRLLPVYYTSVVVPCRLRLSEPRATWMQMLHRQGFVPAVAREMVKSGLVDHDCRLVDHGCRFRCI